MRQLVGQFMMLCAILGIVEARIGSTLWVVPAAILWGVGTAFFADGVRRK